MGCSLSELRPEIAGRRGLSSAFGGVGTSTLPMRSGHHVGLHGEKQRYCVDSMH